MQNLTDACRDFLVRGPKSMGLTGSTDLQKEIGMWSQLPPNIHFSSLWPEELQPVYLRDDQGGGQTVSSL